MDNLSRYQEAETEEQSSQNQIADPNLDINEESDTTE